MNDDDDENVSEFNPYGDFLNDDDGNASLETGSESLPFSENGNGEPAETASENEASSGGDIELPDFMQESVDISDFKNEIKGNPAEAPMPESGNRQDDDFSQKPEESSFHNAGEENLASDDREGDKSHSEGESEQQAGGGTFDEEEEVKFNSKISPEDAEGGKPHGSKPRVLNKKFLLSAIVIVLGSVFLFTFLFPGGSKKKDKKEKPVANTYGTTDYSSLARRQPEATYEDINVKREEPQKNDEEIPPLPQVVVKNEKQPYTQQNINYNTGKGGGGASTSGIPDTRNDSLQGKHISGIKGLTSTQQSYSTDYQQTIAKNTAVGAGTGSSSYTLPSKDEYMNNVLSAYSAAYGNATSQNNSYAVQNDQDGKNKFFNNGRNADDVGTGLWLGLNTIWQGTIFEAVLTSELNTDLPGEITARIAKNIYSSQDGRFLLIPQNSVLYGTYNSSISYSQSRVQVGWHTLIRPDGYQIQLGNMNGTDAKGASGIKGHINDHLLGYLKAIGLMSVFSIINSEFSDAIGDTDNSYVQDVMANSQSVTMELGEKLIDRAMNVQPTITVKAGTKINVVANHNLTLPPCENIPVTQQYHRMR